MNDEWDEEKDNWYGDDDESEYESEDNDPGQLRLCIHCGLACINTPIRAGQRLEFVTNRPPNYSNPRNSGRDDECPF